MKSLILAGAVAVFAASPLSAQPGYRSQSGPRGPSGGVEFAPVDRLGPTLAPNNMLSPDSGWNGHASSGNGIAGPIFSSSDVPPLFAAPPPPPPPKPAGKKPYIILNQ
jgi:hypothetical protein